MKNILPIILLITSQVCLSEEESERYRYVEVTCSKTSIHISERTSSERISETRSDNGALIEIGKLVTIEEKDDHPVVTVTKQEKVYCKYESYVYTVLVEPEIFNYNVLGRCGASSSSAVTVFNGENKVLSKTAFLNDCMSETKINSMEVSMLSQFIVFQKEERVEFERIKF